MTSTDSGVTDFFPLSPMQQGMLYHTLAGWSSDVYCQQATCVLEGPMDETAFVDAWACSLAAHSMLRTGFVWEGLDEPVQVVHSEAKTPVELDDWTSVGADEQESRARRLLTEERGAGFDLRRPPLMRVRLIRLSESKRRLIWTYHHILLDGMSANRVLAEVFESYGQLTRGEVPSPVPSPPYRDYVAWLRGRDHDGAERFWKERLGDFTRQDPPLPDRDAIPGDRSGPGVATARLGLSKEESRRLRGFARAERVTLNTVLQGGWGLTVASYCGADEATFGAVLSVRPPELDGIERGVGLYINTLPVRIRGDARTPVGAWLRHHQAVQADSRQYDYCSLADIQGWAGVPADLRLFDAILVFGNYGGEDPLERTPDGLQLRDYEYWESSNYPLNAYVEPGDSIGLGLVFDVGRFGSQTARRILDSGAIASRVWRPRRSSPCASCRRFRQRRKDGSSQI